MARYDGGWRGGRPGGGWGDGVMPGGADYDRGRAAREAYTPGGFGPEWQRQARTGRYDADFRPDAGRGGGDPDRGHGGDGAPWGEGGTLNGPARYGLGPYHRRLDKRRRPDDELRHEVEEALFYDTWVDAEAITVDVRDGVVTLRGELPDHDEVRYATDDAWDVDGVRGVRSELRVDASKRPPLDHVTPRRSSREESGPGNG
jgi:hypothetical protein